MVLNLLILQHRFVENTDPLDVSEYSTEGLKSKDISHTAAPDSGDD